MSEMAEKKKGKSILWYILVPVFVLSLLEAAIFFAVIMVGGVDKRLKNNAREIVQERVITQKATLETQMLSNWSKVETLANKINTTAVHLEMQKRITLSGIDREYGNAELLIEEVVESMIQSLRNMHVNSIFLVLNSKDLNQSIENKPGIYITDLDPLSNPSERNSDLLIERGPISLVKKLGITTDTIWKPVFNFKESGSYQPFLYYPYQEARERGDFSANDLGYWSTGYKLSEGKRQEISYSIPLILEDGRVYGVLGIGITEEHLKELLPDETIYNTNSGSYCLAVKNVDKETYTAIYGGTWLQFGEEFTVTKEGQGYYLNEQKENIYAAEEILHLYNSNTPFENEEWILMAMIPNKDLLSFSRVINYILILAGLLAVIIGCIGACIISYRLSNPIAWLSKQVDKQKDNADRNSLQTTRITEIDTLVHSIEKLNSRMLESANRFNTVLALASVNLGAFEIGENAEDFFVTENFFEIFRVNVPKGKGMNYDVFQKRIGELEQYVIRREKNKVLFLIPGASDRYVELRMSTPEKGRIIGIAEDITERTLEQYTIEYERDHDALTGLYNRRSFSREIKKVFQNKEMLKTAAFVMLDLDNLKYVNDNFGHDVGDTYICKAAKIFRDHTPDTALLFRISGDEFALFFYGYENEKEIEICLENMKNAMKNASVVLNQEKKIDISASAGISWYPRDAKSLSELQLYADFAMYKVKRSAKGRFENFNLEEYKKEYYLSHNKEELEIMIRDEKVDYHYQPIIDAHTGKIVAYEALMRSTMPTLKNPNEILLLAKEENKLLFIEKLSFFKAMEGFVENVKMGNIEENALIFINSIADQLLLEEDAENFRIRYQEFLPRLVVEITEEERVNVSIQEKKRYRVEKEWRGNLALDDYGSGYNGEKMLLQISPKYIKVDMDIVRDIHEDSDKQKIVENIVSYAHERNMLIIAEGVETIEELKQLIQLDVDLLQGYFFAKPQKNPSGIPDNLVRLVCSLK